MSIEISNYTITKPGALNIIAGLLRHEVALSECNNSKLIVEQVMDQFHLINNSRNHFIRKIAIGLDDRNQPIYADDKARQSVMDRMEEILKDKFLIHCDHLIRLTEECKNRLSPLELSTLEPFIEV